MIEIAAVLSAVVRHWADLIIIVVLLFFNALVGFWQEYKAANALEALKKQLALKARALRDGKWQDLPAGQLVPGDVIRLRLGMIVPADVKLFEGDFLSVDQSALTGESLPVSKKVGDTAYSGSVAKQGEMVALVTSTGVSTYFGRTAILVQAAGAPSHFQKAVLQIGDYLTYLSLVLVAVLILVQLERGDLILSLIQFALILTVASIPVALPAVLSVTMAVGALALSKMKAIVTRLESIEEMAGIDILCSDKTGTLTQNKLTLGDPATFAARTSQELILYGALASKEEDQDPIDLAVLAGIKDAEALQRYKRPLCAAPWPFGLLPLPLTTGCSEFGAAAVPGAGVTAPALGLPLVAAAMDCRSWRSRALSGAECTAWTAKVPSGCSPSSEPILRTAQCMPFRLRPCVTSALQILIASPVCTPSFFS